MLFVFNRKHTESISFVYLVSFITYSNKFNIKHLEYYIFNIKYNPLKLLTKNINC